MTILIAATAVFAFLALLFLFATINQVMNGRMLRATGSLAGGVATASLGGLGAVLIGSILSYHQLVAEQRVALIEFSQDGPREYMARLMLEDELDRLLPMRGDEWQLDARVVTWQPPATILGLEPIYQLERLSGRYADVERELREPRSVHSLVGENPLDVWRIARRFPALLPGIDAYYGTAAYLPMADGARYEVTLSRDALIARPVNDAARDAVGSWAPGRL